jgi:hypothetical protein
MPTTTQRTSSSKIGLSSLTAHPILTIFSLLFALLALTVSQNPKVREYAAKKWHKIRMRLYIKPCGGMCGISAFHTHDLTLIGKWHFMWRYRLQDILFRDPRPTPPVDATQGAPWIDEYEADWRNNFPGYNMASCFVRDAQGFWVWVTNTPQWDRDWFEKKGWRFPTAWITGPSKTFYQIGKDALSTVVSLPPKEGGSSVQKDESW